MRENIFLLFISILVISLFVASCSPPHINTGPEIDRKETSAAEFSIQEIEKHSSGESCWLLINGKVYNVTSMINAHPGGDAIIEGCGINATDLYETRPMGSGTPHSDRARENLERFYIGTLKK